MQGAFFGKQQAGPVRVWLLGLGCRVRCAGCRVRGWAGCFHQIQGAQNPSYPPTQAPLPGRGAKQVQPVLESSSDANGRAREGGGGGAPLFTLVGILNK